MAEAVHAIWSTVSQQQTTTTAMSSVADHVVINEFEQNPPGDERTSGGEFIELYNPTASAVDISGWIIYTTHGDIESYVIPAGTVLPSHGFWQVTFAGQFIDNEQDSLVLLNALGQQVDATSNKTDEQNDSKSWQRYPDGSDNWVFAPSTRSIINVPEYPSPPLLALAVMTSVFLILRRFRGVV